MNFFNRNSFSRLNIRGYLYDLIKLPLFYNAWYILGVNVIPALIGFLFWKTCSYFFSTTDIGVGAAALSAAGFVTGISNLGINVGIVRYLPKAKNARDLLNTSISLTLLASLSLAILFIIGIPIWSPKLLILRSAPLFLLSFCILVVSTTTGTFLRGAYVAKRQSILAFIYTTIANVIGFILLFFFIAHPIHAILTSNTIGYSFAVIIGWFFLNPKIMEEYKFRFSVNGNILKALLPYSFSNYFATFLFQSYQTIFPLLVLNILGAEASGFIYVAIMIVSAAISPGLALGYSAFSE